MKDLRAKNEIIQTVKIKRYTAYYFNRTLCFVINDYTTVGKQIKSSDFSEKKANLLFTKKQFMKSYTLMEKRES
jgi:hypothetical protein